MPNILQFITSLMTRSVSEEFVLFDIGACDGLHTQKFLRTLSGLKRPFQVYSFEPLHRNFVRLSRVVDKHNAEGTSGTAYCFEQAVGSSDGVIDFWVAGPMEKYWGSSSIRAPKLVNAPHNWPDMTFTESEALCTTLDTFTTERHIGEIDFIWCDVQGAEGDVVQGGQQVFSRTRYFFTEYHNAELQEGQIIGVPRLLELLKTSAPGWEVLVDYGGEVLFVNRGLENGS